MVEEDVINSRIEGAIRGAEIIKQNVRGKGPCLSPRWSYDLPERGGRL